MTEIRVSTGYRPREHQSLIHRALKRFNVLACHRRFGKTVLCINELIDRALRCGRPRPRYAYVAPLYRQAKQVAWDYLKHYTAEIPRRNVNETELRVDLPGDRRIQLFGADNPDALRGIYLDGVVLDEYAQMPPRLWGEVIRPLLADRDGFAIFIGTPMGHNQFWDLYDQATHGFWTGEGEERRREADANWTAMMFRASQTGILPEEEIRQLKRVLQIEEFEQELECSFTAAVKGAYYGRLMAQADEQGRITRVPHDPVAKVDTWWDLGVRDPTAIWFTQRVGKEIRCIDYYEGSGVGLQHYAGVLDERARKGGWVYGKHIGPHDLRNRSLGTGQTILETASSLGLPFEVVDLHRREQGIQAARNIIPICWFDAEKCERGIEALRLYRVEWDDKLATFRQNPLHDWTSHAADAFRYGAMYKPTQSDFHKPLEYREPAGYYV